ncbi:hypothetical protein HG531_004843 [Fusarium graminearum]|nr:hypothetical protein HG531_004843 [Fusarium graminearum]
MDVTDPIKRTLPPQSILAICSLKVPDGGRVNLRNSTAHDRGDNSSDSPYTTNNTSVHASLSDGHHIADNNLRHGENAPTANALNRTTTNHHGSVVRATTETAAECKDTNSDQSEATTAIYIGSLGKDGNSGCRRQEIRVNDPYVERIRAKVSRDSGQGGGNDGCVEGSEKCGQRNGDKDEPKASTFFAGCSAWW